MTKDASPKNLRKFLESDDPAKVLKLIGSSVNRWEELIEDYDEPSAIDFNDHEWYWWTDCLELISEISEINDTHTLKINAIDTLKKLIEISICWSGNELIINSIISKMENVTYTENEVLGRHYINWLHPKVTLEFGKSPFPCLVPYEVFEAATEALQKITNKADVLPEILKSREEEFQKYFLPIKKREKKRMEIELQGFLFSEYSEIREKGLLKARKMNYPKSYLMIKALAKWDPDNSERAEDLLKEFKIPLEWTEEEEMKIMPVLLKEKPTDILYNILYNQGIDTSINSERCPETLEITDNIYDIIRVLADSERDFVDRTYEHRERLIGMIDPDKGPIPNDYINGGIIGISIEKGWTEISAVLVNIIKDDGTWRDLRANAINSLKNFNMNEIVEAYLINQGYDSKSDDEEDKEYRDELITYLKDLGIEGDYQEVIEYEDDPAKNVDDLIKSAKNLLGENAYEILTLKKNIMNLGIEPFSKLVESKSELLSEVKGAISNETLIELTKESGQSRWLIAFHLFIIDTLEKPTFDALLNYKIEETGFNELFFKHFSEYTEIVTKTDLDALKKILINIPVLLTHAIGRSLFNAAILMTKNKGLNDVQKNNMEIGSLIFQDPGVAKSVLGRM